MPVVSKLSDCPNQTLESSTKINTENDLDPHLSHPQPYPFPQQFYQSIHTNWPMFFALQMQMQQSIFNNWLKEKGIEKDCQSTRLSSYTSPSKKKFTSKKIKIPDRVKAPKKENLSKDIDDVVESYKLQLVITDSEFPVIDRKSKFFVIKSFTEEDVHRAVKYKVWCSTYYGNRRLQYAWDNVKSKPNAEIYLFFSVNGSGHFCGIAKMTSNVNQDASKTQDIWSKDEHNEGGYNSKWRGYFNIEWLYIKDIPNSEFNHLKVVKNRGKPLSHSRDAQEILKTNGEQVLKIFHNYTLKTSLLQDFGHYDKVEEKQRMKERRTSYTFYENSSKINKSPQKTQKKTGKAKKSTEKKYDQDSGVQGPLLDAPPNITIHTPNDIQDHYSEQYAGVRHHLKQACVDHLLPNTTSMYYSRDSALSLPEYTFQLSKEISKSSNKEFKAGPNAIKIVKPEIPTDTAKVSSIIDSAEEIAIST